MFLAHAPISYLANEAIQKNKISELKNSQQIFVAVFSLLFGVLPDLDFLILIMTDRPSYSHHDFFTHTPIYWIVLWAVLLLISKVIYPRLTRRTKQFLTKDLLNILLNAFLIGGLVHFAADLLVGNIMLLYPFSNTHFTIFRYLFEPSYFTGYFFSVYFAIEIVVVAIFFLLFSKRFFKKVKWDNWVAYILIGLSSTYLLFTIFINIQTYNNSFLEESNKPYIDYDQDYDTLRDIEDWDVDNNGVDNIEDADMRIVVSNVQNILDSHKLAVGENENFLDRIYLHYGAFDSYRLVSQAFYENHTPIEPVLKYFYIKKLEEKKYTVSYNPTEVLRDYFASKGDLIAVNYKANPLLSPGKIFFLLNGDNEIVNIGITMENNHLGIILPGEKQMQDHTLEGITLFYNDTISTFQILQ